MIKEACATQHVKKLLNGSTHQFTGVKKAAMLDWAEKTIHF
jgi:hypothetical protein